MFYDMKVKKNDIMFYESLYMSVLISLISETLFYNVVNIGRWTIILSWNVYQNHSQY